MAHGLGCPQFYMMWNTNIIASCGLTLFTDKHPPEYTAHSTFTCAVRSYPYTYFALDSLQDSLIANSHARTDFLHKCFRIIPKLACSVLQLMYIHTHANMLQLSPTLCTSLSGEVISFSSVKGEDGENVIFSFKHLFSAHWAWRQASRAEVLKFGWLTHIFV